MQCVYIYISSDKYMYVDIYLCMLCDSVLNTNNFIYIYCVTDIFFLMYILNCGLHNV